MSSTFEIALIFVGVAIALFVAITIANSLGETADEETAFCSDYIFRTDGWGSSQRFCPQEDGTVREFICDYGDCYWLKKEKELS